MPHIPSDDTGDPDTGQGQENLVESAWGRWYAQWVAPRGHRWRLLFVRREVTRKTRSMSSHERVEQEIRTFLKDNFPLSADGVTLESDDSLIEVGVIDSTGVLELIGFIEERYEIAIADEEVLPENLDSIANITRFVSEKTRAGSNGGG
jgi:acyl carrier protein